MGGVERIWVIAGQTRLCGRENYLGRSQYTMTLEGSRRSEKLIKI